MKAMVCSSSKTLALGISPAMRRQKMQEPCGEVSTKLGMALSWLVE